MLCVISETLDHHSQCQVYSITPIPQYSYTLESDPQEHFGHRALGLGAGVSRLRCTLCPSRMAYLPSIRIAAITPTSITIPILYLHWLLSTYGTHQIPGTDHTQTSPLYHTILNPWYHLDIQSLLSPQVLLLA